MAVEFALRPRIRLREHPAPARRARPRLPKFALPALAYWLVVGGLVYEFVQHHDASAPPPEAQAALAPLGPVPPAPIREWWRPLPASAPLSASPPIAEASTPEAVAAPQPEAIAAPQPEAIAAPQPEAATAELRPKESSVAEAPLPTAAHAPRRLPGSTLRPAAVLGSEPVKSPSLAPSLAVRPEPTLASEPTVAPVLPSPAVEVAGTLPSCEAALASANQDVDFSGGNRTADLPTQAIAAVLENGAWLSSCAVPEQTALDVCVAIKGGRVVGASVSSRPANSALNSCLKRRASSLQFPYSPHLDLARTRF